VTATFEPIEIPRERMTDERVKVWAELIRTGRMVCETYENGEWKNVATADSQFGQNILHTEKVRGL
jgi:hypothetical protein